MKLEDMVCTICRFELLSSPHIGEMHSTTRTNETANGAVGLCSVHPTILLYDYMMGSYFDRLAHDFPVAKRWQATVTFCSPVGSAPSSLTCSSDSEHGEPCRE